VKDRRSAPTRSAQRLRRLVACLAGSALSLLATGCPEPGDLENVDKFCKPGQSVVGANNEVTGCTESPSSGGSGGGSGASCDTACITALFSSTCTVCHKQATALGQLDLETAGVAARLKDQPAKHAEVGNAQGCPSGDKLIDSANPSASWLLKKISKQQGDCGTPMPAPQGGSEADIACVDAYVKCVSASP